jgi:hypothetical protein
VVVKGDGLTRLLARVVALRHVGSSVCNPSVKIRGPAIEGTDVADKQRTQSPGTKPSRRLRNCSRLGRGRSTGSVLPLSFLYHSVPKHSPSYLLTHTELGLLLRTTSLIVGCLFSLGISSGSPRRSKTWRRENGETSPPVVRQNSVRL